MKQPLGSIAHTRSGDKGDTSNVGVHCLRSEALSDHRPRGHARAGQSLSLGDLVKGEVERFELPNLGAINLLLREALGGGGTVSLRVDAQGKTYGAALLRMEIEVD